MKETGAINDSFLVSGRYEWSKNVGIFYVVLSYISIPVQLVISVVTWWVMAAPAATATL